MADDRIVLRKQDGSGAGVIYNSRKEANEFLKNNPDYAEEAEAKAVAPAENKAVEAPKADA